MIVNYYSYGDMTTLPITSSREVRPESNVLFELNCIVTQTSAGDLTI